MKVILITIIIFFIISIALLAIGDDKLMHFGISALASATTYIACRAVFNDKGKLPCMIAAGTFTMGLGIAKEIMDGSANSTSEHAKDLAADLLGTGFGLLIAIPF